MMISKKKGAACKQRHAHQATGNTGGRGKCSRYYYYRPIHEKSLVFFLFLFVGHGVYYHSSVISSSIARFTL